MFKKLFKSRAKVAPQSKPKLKARYYGTHGEEIRGAVYCPDHPEAVFNVEWIEEAGDGNYKVLGTMRADSNELHCSSIPAGHGFKFPTTEIWSDGLIHRVNFRVKETGKIFPDSKKFYDPKQVGSFSGNVKTSTFKCVYHMLSDPMFKSNFNSHLIVVTHDMTRTGAPMIALNLIRYLERCAQKVTCISLAANGDMLEDFAKISTNILQPKSNSREDIHEFIDDLSGFFTKATEFHPAVAIMNSLCSQPIAHALKHAQIPTLWLFHEFPNMFRPVVVTSAIDAADRLIFPCQLIKDSYQSYFKQLVESDSVDESTLQLVDQASIIPQGVWWAQAEKVASPMEEVSSSDIAKTREEWGPGADDFVVICVGTADVRKAADWLVQFARTFITAHPDTPVRFVWVGELPENVYTGHLALDVECFGLEKYVHFVGSTDKMREAYASADLMLMCSRLDPFPNVVLEAMLHRLPVLAFDQGQGTSDFISESKAGTIVPYMDFEAAGKALQDYVLNSETCEKHGENGLDAVKSRLSHEDFGRSILNALIELVGKRNAISQLINAKVLKSPDLLPEPLDNASSEGDENLVLVRGQMKSGTNWICNILNHHPEVCIRGEYHWDSPDWKTPGSTNPQLGVRFDAAMRVASGLPGVSHYGDRTPSTIPDPYFPDAKTVYIHRDPRDLLISNAFHHLNNAVAREESLPKLSCPIWLNLIERHLDDPKLIESQPHLLLESSEIVDYLIAIKERNLPAAVAYLEENDTPNILVVGYETLHHEFDTEIERIFSFLGLKTDALLPFKKKTKPGFEGNSNNRNFFRKGQPGDWRNYLHQEDARELWSRLSGVMKWGGYEDDDQWIDSLPKRSD